MRSPQLTDSSIIVDDRREYSTSERATTM